MTYGLTSSGFNLKPLPTILSDIQAAERTNIDAAVDVSADEVLGQVNGIVAAMMAELWEVAQAVYSAFDPNASTGDALAALANITGTSKKSATHSTSGIALTGTPGTTIPAGSIVALPITGGERFDLDADVTLDAVPAWGGTTAYNPGDPATNGGKVYLCTTGGLSAGAGGPTGTGAAITDGTVVWFYIGAGTGAGLGTVTAENTGTIVAAVGTLTSIVTPVAGWSSSSNIAAATPGIDEETDAALRLRREIELRATGESTVDGIREAVLAVPGVTACVVFENDTDAVVGSLPAHSFEAVVLGGAANAIAQAIWDAKPAGIRAYGSTGGTATDALGDSQSVAFTRPVSNTTYFIFDISKGAAYPTDGDQQITDAVVAFANANYGIGTDVILSRLYPVLLAISGVDDVITIYAGFAPAPVGTANLSLGDHDIAVVFDATIVVL